MKKIEIISHFGRYRRGQIVEMNDFDAGHALGFKYGVIHGGRPVETQAVSPPETRAVDHVHEAPADVVEDEPKQPFFKRRGRRSKA